MKVFNYTTGKKGELLGEIRCPSFATGYPVYNNCYVKHNWEDRGESRWEIQESVGYVGTSGKTVYIHPSMFGTDAICFCTGKWSDRWTWNIVGNDEWLEKGIAAGVFNLVPLKDPRTKLWSAAVITKNNDRILLIVEGVDAEDAAGEAMAAATEMGETDIRDVDVFEYEDDYDESEG